MSATSIDTTTVMMCLLFGTNAFFFFLFRTIKSVSNGSNGKSIVDKKPEKELSKPFEFTLDGFTNLTTELFLTGLIMGLTYVCENHWIFDHSGKEYSRDLFAFVIIVFFLYAFYTIKPNHDLALLGREQTEEWKGWMQFIFLLYHYFHAEEVYNSVRVMITCYVWMTGFGNFSFFFMKQDFGWLRVVQMLWRLNFSVLLLMWTHGNTYILYYICPMHTFYFLMVYATMYVFASWNHSKWAIRFKLLAVGVLIYLIWDVDSGLFDILFGFLGTKSVIGASRGSVWEYYFRTSLDHWSSYLGMIFALNFPLAEQFFVKAKGFPLVVAACLMGVLTVYWFGAFYMKDKLAYNLTHSYSAIIPLTSYIFFRNITPWMRGWVSMSLHDMGKTTLETYLLQHHIWLTSNAKTLLTLVPGHPWINFALATMLFFTVSKELYRITMSLRGMLLPEDKTDSFRNCIGMSVVMGLLYLVALAINVHQGFSLFSVTVGCLTLFLAATLVISRFCRPLAELPLYQIWSARAVGFALVAVVLCLIVLVTSPDSLLTADALESSKAIPPFRGQSVECQNAVSAGSWTLAPCVESPSTQSLSIFKLNTVAFCDTDQWKWDAASTADCPIGRITSSKAKNIFKGKSVIFTGDSIVRGSYHQFIALLDPKYKDPTQNISSAITVDLKHVDLTYAVPGFANTSVSFLWAPFAQNITELFQRRALPADLLVAGAATWDALHSRNRAEYARWLDVLINTPTIAGLKNSAVPIWLQPTTIVNGRLSTPEKRSYMTESDVQGYRETFLASKAAAYFQDRGAVISPINACAGREGGSVDGVHYDQEVNQVIVQMLANAYAMRFPALYTPSKTATYKTVKEQTPKPTGSMSFPSYGALVLTLSIVMLFTMDNWLGIGYIALLLGGRHYDWEAAFGPLLSKVLRVPGASSSGGAHSVQMVNAANTQARAHGEEKDSFLEPADK